jgi:hypothetical protein
MPTGSVEIYEPVFVVLSMNGNFCCWKWEEHMDDSVAENVVVLDVLQVRVSK